MAGCHDGGHSGRYEGCSWGLKFKEEMENKKGEQNWYIVPADLLTPGISDNGNVIHVRKFSDGKVVNYLTKVSIKKGVWEWNPESKSRYDDKGPKFYFGKYVHRKPKSSSCLSVPSFEWGRNEVPSSPKDVKYKWTHTDETIPMSTQEFENVRIGLNPTQPIREYDSFLSDYLYRKEDNLKEDKPLFKVTKLIFVDDSLQFEVIDKNGMMSHIQIAEAVDADLTHQQKEDGKDFGEKIVEKDESGPWVEVKNPRQKKKQKVESNMDADLAKQQDEDEVILEETDESGPWSEVPTRQHRWNFDLTGVMCRIAR